MLGSPASSNSVLSRRYAVPGFIGSVQAHIIPKNPTENATVPKSNYKPMQVLNEQELDTFLQAVQNDDVWRDFFYTELMTGLRRGELLALQWDDLDFETGVLTISKQVSLVRGKIVMSVPKTKNSIRKLVPF